MLALAGSALLAIVVGAPAPIRWPVVFAAVVLVPGSAIMTLIPVNDVGGWLGLAVALSLGVGVVGSTVTLWLGWWHPLVSAAAIALASCVAFVLDLRSSSRAPSVSVA
jgi:hypothetical protein